MCIRIRAWQLIKFILIIINCVDTLNEHKHKHLD